MNTKALKSYFLGNCAGVIEPNHKTLLHIHFEPKHKNQLDTYLVIVLHYDGKKLNNNLTTNNNRIIIQLTGIGLKAELHFSDVLINFESTLPDGISEKYLAIENVCEFPLEFSFVDFDE